MTHSESESVPDPRPTPPRADVQARFEFHAHFDLHADGTARGRMVPLASLTPEARAELARQADPANWSEAARRHHAAWERVVALGVPDHGLAVGPLPHGAVAVAVRDPGAHSTRLVVVRPDADDDAPVRLGESALRIDETAHAEPAARRLLFVLPDRRVRIETNGRVEWTPLTVKLGSAERLLWPKLQAAAAGVTPTPVPGVGAVRLVWRPSDAAGSAAKWR